MRDSWPGARACGLFSLAALLAMTGGCDSTGDAPAKPSVASAPASPVLPPAAEPAKPAPVAPPTPPAQAPPAPTPPAATPDAAPPGTGRVEPSSLAGKVGFDWLHPRKSKCKALDAATVKSLVDGKAECSAHPASEAFSEGAGPWHSCKLGDKEWFFYADMKICKDNYETMMANGD